MSNVPHDKIQIMKPAMVLLPGPLLTIDVVPAMVTPLNQIGLVSLD